MSKMSQVKNVTKMSQICQNVTNLSKMSQICQKCHKIVKNITKLLKISNNCHKFHKFWISSAYLGKTMTNNTCQRLVSVSFRFIYLRIGTEKTVSENGTTNDCALKVLRYLYILLCNCFPNFWTQSWHWPFARRWFFSN